MARIVPSNIAQLEMAGASRSEMDTLRFLQASLSDAYTVFHGVHWTREYQGHTVFGEVDFIVVNRTGRALVIEQKNGVLRATPDGLVAQYRDGDKPVAAQIHRALDNLREKFRRVHAAGARLDLEYLLYCPDHQVDAVNAVGLDASRVVDARSRAYLGDWIENHLGPGHLPDPVSAELVVRFLCQSFDVVPDIHAHMVAQERQFVRQSSRLVELLSALEMASLRLRIWGTAGSGKTMIARHFFDRALRQGRRPLLVCFNRPLSERLKVVVETGGRVTTWYALIADFLREKGQNVDFAQMHQDPEFWERVRERVVGEHIPLEWQFDVLVVDEGQDFEQEWVETLRLFLTDAHDELWLEDPDQNVRGRPAVVLPGFVGYRARVNYRSPRRIARFIQATLPFAFECGNDLPGLGVGVTAYDDPAQQPALVARIVDQLLRQGFRHADIVILTTRHTIRPDTPRSALQARERVANYTLRRFTGEYDLLGNQVLDPGQLVFDSVRRFKGQEAAAVILVDVDPAPDDPDQAARVLFSGMTRATVRLEILARRGNPSNDRILSLGGA